jgi:hypothetical protein
MDLQKWIGKKREEVNEFETSLGSVFTCKEYKDVSYIEYKTKGICLVYEKVNGTLDSIHIYNHGCYGYHMYNGTLPCNLDWKMKNREVVAQLGEPDKKGGESIPVWISYESRGIQIDFVNKSFDDVQNPIAFITCFH